MLNYPTRGWPALLWTDFKTLAASNSVFLIRVVHFSSILENQGIGCLFLSIPPFCIESWLSSVLRFECLAFGCCGSTSFFWKHFRGDLRRVCQQKSTQRWMSRLASGCYDAPKHRLLWWGPPTRKKHVGRPVTSTWFYQQTNPSSNQPSKSIRPSSFHLHSSFYTIENWKCRGTQCNVNCLNSMSRATVPPVPA